MEYDFNDVKWLRRLRERGQAPWLLALLDAFEPFAPLGAQMIWVAQPGVGWLLGHERMDLLAKALETPEGVAALRQYLSDDVPYD